ncbi:hypothetical protein [Enterovibrio norvegicus]|uniref:hypothetical protein n=1 Tax=Enterovibrio norvegicus TaxID=188144 RepID=UPI000C8484E1|nr:hypothetical protein [Enterovibrio norvegicus]PMH64562.1 hypothetical protein BCU62_16025 [Enterovibrio norvegicus]
MKSIFVASMVAVALLSSTAHANLIRGLEVTQSKIIDSELGNSKYQYQINGIEIELTESEKHKAKNWRLTEQDWAKYKYVMEYLPRGLWTPNLDPPIVLGNLAATDEERLRLAKIQNAIEMERMKGEADFAKAVTLLAYMENPSSNPNYQTPRTGIAAKLPSNKDTLRSIFVDLKTCDSQCKTFITLALASSSSSTKIDLHVTGGNERATLDLLNQIGINENKIRSKSISISASIKNPAVEKFRNGGTVPFHLTKTGEETLRSHM